MLKEREEERRKGREFKKMAGLLVYLRAH